MASQVYTLGFVVSSEVVKF